MSPKGEPSQAFLCGPRDLSRRGFQSHGGPRVQRLRYQPHQRQIVAKLVAKRLISELLTHLLRPLQVLIESRAVTPVERLLRSHDELANARSRGEFAPNDEQYKDAENTKPIHTTDIGGYF